MKKDTEKNDWNKSLEDKSINKPIFLLLLIIYLTMLFTSFALVPILSKDGYILLGIFSVNGVILSWFGVVTFKNKSIYGLNKKI